MKSKLKVSLFSIFFILISCEKDDICIEDEIGTPRVILSFYDKIDKNLRKPVENLLIKGLEKEDTLDIFSGDSIAIPLKNDSNLSKYEFIINAGEEKSNNDTIHIWFTLDMIYILKSMWIFNFYTK